MTSYLEMNRTGWDRRTIAHFESRFYDVDGFLEGRTSLREIERAELTDVAGKRLLHLQCHFGLDTLSWARQGAICTGVDISPVAIGKARKLAVRAGLIEGTVRAFLSLEWAFKAPVFAGDTIKLQAEVTRLRAMPSMGGGMVRLRTQIFGAKNIGDRHVALPIRAKIRAMSLRRPAPLFS